VVAQLDSVREYDLIGGLAGVALYFLERPRAELRGLALGRIVSRLDELRDGPLWRDHESRIDPGLAHGAPGVLAALARIEPPPRAPGSSAGSRCRGRRARTCSRVRRALRSRSSPRSEASPTGTGSSRVTYEDTRRRNAVRDPDAAAAARARQDARGARRRSD